MIYSTVVLATRWLIHALLRGTNATTTANYLAWLRAGTTDYCFAEDERRKYIL